MSNYPCRVICASGAHGVGKDTILRIVKRRLEEKGFDVLLLPELAIYPDPRYCTLGDLKDVIGFANSEYTYLMSYMIQSHNINKEKERYQFILKNRSVWDFMVYLKRCKDLRVVGCLSAIFTEFMQMMLPQEDLICYLCLSTDDNVERIQKRTENLEGAGIREDFNEGDRNYLKAIKKGFDDFFSYLPNVAKFDASKQPETIADHIMSELENRGWLVAGKY